MAVATADYNPFNYIERYYSKNAMAKKTAKRKTSKKPTSKSKAKATPPRNRTNPSTKPKATTKKPTPCNQRQLKFAQEYALSGNATAAAINAGYSPSTATATASRLLKNPKIEKEIQALQEDAKKEFKVTREDLYEKYNQAFKLGALVGAPAAMVSAATGMARLFGLDKYKVEHEGGLEIIVYTGIPSGEDDSGETG